MSFLLGLGALLLLWIGSREVFGGRSTVGPFVAVNARLTTRSSPMIAFGWVTNMLQRGLASWKRMLEVLETPPSIADRGLRPSAGSGRPEALEGRVADRIADATAEAVPYDRSGAADRAGAAADTS